MFVRNKTLGGSAVLPGAVLLALLGHGVMAEPVVRPRLIVVMVIDQLRGDVPDRFAAGFVSDAGFARLIGDGLAYDQAYYEHATTSTAPGHATLFTGAHPSQHGIVSNQWYDPVTKQRIASVGFSAKTTGPGPENLLTSTIADELVLSCGSRCKVFAVSGKGRGAVFAAGRLGKALWFDDKGGGFRSSRYYYAQLPSWVERWNDDHGTAYATDWRLLLPNDRYQLAEHDDRAFERPPRTMGRTFPHPLGNPRDPEFFKRFRHTPHLDELTLDFAKAVIEAAALGADEQPDLLSVSLSATDYIGHAFGPDSLEAEDNLVRLDQQLGSFVSFLDERVGRAAYMLVITADHGITASPEDALEAGFPAHRIPLGLVRQTAVRALADEFALPGSAIADLCLPNLYLDHGMLAARGIAIGAAAEAVAKRLTALAGIAEAVVLDSPAHRSRLDALVRNSVNERSGDIYIVIGPHSAIVENPLLYTAFHGSPYPPDRHVPLYVFGAGLPAARIARRVSPRMLVPTLAGVLGVPRPAHAEADVLHEVLERRAVPRR